MYLFTYSKHVTIFFTIDALYDETKPEVVCPLAELLRGMGQSLSCVSQAALKGNSFSWKTIMQISMIKITTAVNANRRRKYSNDAAQKGRFKSTLWRVGASGYRYTVHV